MVGNQKVACAPSACLERKRGNDVGSLQKAKRKGRWRDAVAGLMRRGCRPEKGTRAHGVPWKSFFSYLLICLVLDDKCWYTLALIDLYTVFCSETIPQFTVEVEPEVRKRSRYACITTCTSVFESEELIAFLDISPVNKGHTLLVPKAHMETLFDMPAGIGETLFAAMKQVGSAVMKATGAEGLNVVQNNYSAAGQQVPHVHWHLIPRFADDGYTAWPQGAYQDMQEMAALADAIREKL